MKREAKCYSIGYLPTLFLTTTAPGQCPPRAELPMSAPSALRAAPGWGWRAAAPRGAPEGTAAPHRPRLPSQPCFSEHPTQLPAAAAPYAARAPATRAPPPRLSAPFGLRSRGRGAPPPPPPPRTHRGAGAQPRRAAALPGRPRSAAAAKRILGQRPKPASERALGGSSRAGDPFHPPRPSSSPFSFPRLKNFIYLQDPPPSIDATPRRRAEETCSSGPSSPRARRQLRGLWLCPGTRPPPGEGCEEPTGQRGLSGGTGEEFNGPRGSWSSPKRPGAHEETSSTAPCPGTAAPHTCAGEMKGHNAYK